MALLNSCNRGHVDYKAKKCPVWPFTEEVCPPLLWSVALHSTVEAGLLSPCLFFSLWEEGLVIGHTELQGGGEIQFAAGHPFAQLKLWGFHY